VESVSAPGDVIKILRSPADASPLDGGIALKDGQHLMGSGPPVTTAAESEPRAKITNSDPSRYGGDAIVLADHNVVTNLHIINADRAGIAAAGVKSSWIYGNLITGTTRVASREQSCLASPLGQQWYLTDRAQSEAQRLDRVFGNGVLVQNFGTLTDLGINVARSTLSRNALANFWTQHQSRESRGGR
jgi:hypothetical protein